MGQKPATAVLAVKGEKTLPSHGKNKLESDIKLEYRLQDLDFSARTSHTNGQTMRARLVEVEEDADAETTPVQIKLPKGALWMSSVLR